MQGWKYNTVGKVLALHWSTLVKSPASHNVSHALPGIIPEHNLVYKRKSNMNSLLACLTYQ